MSKIFQASKSFVDYITMMGFQFKEADSNKKYYVNKKGNQIKIDFDAGLISLLDSKGYTINYSSTFTNEQIDKFSVRETQTRDSKGNLIN